MEGVKTVDHGPGHTRINRPTPPRTVFPDYQPSGGGGGGVNAADGHDVAGSELERPAPPPLPPTPVQSTPPSPVARQGQSRTPTDLVFVVREDGEIVFGNTPLGGLSEDELVGTSIYDWVLPEQRGEMQERLLQAFATGVSQEVELSGIAQHDTDAWYECRVTPNFREGKAVSATLVAHEITRHKDRERELNEQLETLKRLFDERTADLDQARSALAAGHRDAADSETRRFRCLLDDAGEAIFITDREAGEIVDVNETACRWLRRSRSRLIGQRAQDLDLGYSIVVPEDLELQLTETRDTRRPHILDRGAHRRSDGSTFPVEVAVATHKLDDREYVLAVVRDMKSQRQSEDLLRETEAQYRLLFEQSWDAIYITARDGQVVDANGAALELFGYARQDFLDLNARELFADAEQIRQFRREMTRAGTVEGLEVRLRTRDGLETDALLSATRRRDSRGAIRGYQCMVRALSEPVRSDPVVVEEARRNGTVLVIEEEAAGLADMTAALEEAGLHVLTAATQEESLRMFRDHRESLLAVVVDVGTAWEPSRETLAEMRGLDGRAQFVLVSGADPVLLAEQFADLGVAAFLTRPAHPLALIQKIRELQ